MAALEFFNACRTGDLAALAAMLDREPDLVRARDAEGSTGLHLAVAHPAAVRLLLARGADPNARDTGDNAYALHFAAANGYLDTVRALLDAGSDVHGTGDVHEGDVIGWAVGDPKNAAVVRLLIERGARHHIFSAIATGDRDLVREVVRANPKALERRRSRFEQHQTPLHFALSAPDGLMAKPAQYDMADLLIELGADVDAKDDRGRTALDLAMLHGDVEAMRRLKQAGAKLPESMRRGDVNERLAQVSESIVKQIPMLCVDDVDATVAWLQAVGFVLRERVPDTGPMGWAYLALGKVAVMVQDKGGRPGRQIALWFYTDRLEEWYQLYKELQLDAARAALAGEPVTGPIVKFSEDLNEPHYGGKQFGIEDVNGFEIYFRRGE